MAEDFHQNFERGSDKLLNGQEVEMALWLAVQELTKRNEALLQSNEALTQRVAEIEAQMKSNSSRSSSNSPLPKAGRPMGEGVEGNELS